jgi:microcystin-dependent protein
MTGTVLDFAGAVAPAGWLLCDGSSVSRTTYANLFSVIGTTHGSGDGSTTFSLPDGRGRVIAGKGDMGGTAAGRLNVNLNGTTTAASAVITGLSSTANLAVGMGVYGATIPASATVASIDSATQVTLSTGVGVTAGTATAMRFGMLDATALGASGGSQTHKLVTSQMPAHTHTYAAVTNTGASGLAGGTGFVNQTTTGSSTGGDQAHPNVQPTLILNKIIKT